LRTVVVVSYVIIVLPLILYNFGCMLTLFF
jgi:hypothetical protein